MPASCKPHFCFLCSLPRFSLKRRRYVKHWIEPNVDISKWEYFDLSCAKRDATDDKGAESISTCFMLSFVRLTPISHV